MKKLFIFDCFGVICGEIAPIWFANRYGEEKAAELKPKYFKGADLGEKTLAELFDVLSKDLGIDIKDIVREWQDLIIIDKDMMNFIEHLKKTESVALLSNAPEGLIEWVFDGYEMKKYFDRVFISGECKIAKPDKNFYRMCVDSFDDKFDKIYMIDDNISNLNGLEEIGITPILYTDLPKMKKDIGYNAE